MNKRYGFWNPHTALTVVAIVAIAAVGSPALAIDSDGDGVGDNCAVMQDISSWGLIKASFR